jgi:hypothetical protein
MSMLSQDTARRIIARLEPRGVDGLPLSAPRMYGDEPINEQLAPAPERKVYTMGDWFRDLDNPHGNR